MSDLAERVERLGIEYRARGTHGAGEEDASCGGVGVGVGAATWILQHLPGEMSWAVLFRLDAYREIVDDVIVDAMFSLPPDSRAQDDTYVILTPLGPLLSNGRDAIRFAYSGTVPSVGESMERRFFRACRQLPALEPDCLGVGSLYRGGEVGLHVVVNGVEGDGFAALDAEPDAQELQLLNAVGVQFKGGRWIGDQFLAHFTNRLEQHVLAGALAGFSRADHCVQFFLRGARLTPSLEIGLTCAALDRIGRGQANAAIAVRTMAAAVAGNLSEATVTSAASEHGRSVEATIVGPCPDGSGDGVCPPENPVRSRPTERTAAASVTPRADPDGADPADALDLAFLHWAVREFPEVEGVRRALISTRGSRWDAAAVAPLVAMLTTNVAALPQLGAAAASVGSGRSGPADGVGDVRDVIAAAAVTFLKRLIGVPCGEELLWLSEYTVVPDGAGLADPALIRWLLSLAVSTEFAPEPSLSSEVTQRLAEAVVEQTLAARNADHTFGHGDRVFGTASAILTLANLGNHGSDVLLAQLKLLELTHGGRVFDSGTPALGRTGGPQPVTTLITASLTKHALSALATPAGSVVAMRKDHCPVSPARG